MACSVCDDCALRLFNSKGHNIQGIGTALYGNMIVLPYIDKSAYKLQRLDYSKLVSILCDSSMGELPINYAYITSIIKCRETINLEMTDDIRNRCITYLTKEVIEFKPRTILCLGNAAHQLFNVPVSKLIDKIIVSNGIIYFFNYSPGVAKYDADKFEEFKQHYAKYYGAIKNKNYYGYEIIKV